MSELKCPFCNETELEKGIELQSGGFILGCPKCKKFAQDVFWQELIRTRKALEIAIDGIKYMRNNCLEYAADYMDKADEILEQIKALEQKEHFAGVSKKIEQKDE